MRWGIRPGGREPDVPAAGVPSGLPPAPPGFPWALAGLVAVLTAVVLLAAGGWVDPADLANQVLAELLLLVGVSAVAAVAHRRTRR